MLPDGAWIYLNAKTQKALFPKPLLEKAAGTPVEIYSLAATDDSQERVVACTNQGVFFGAPADGGVKPIPLPDVRRPKAVVPCVEDGNHDPNRYGLSLLPSEGGTSYVLDLKVERITRQGCVDETYPRAYWFQKPAKYKLDRIQAAMTKADLKWPWASDLTLNSRLPRSLRTRNSTEARPSPVRRGRRRCWKCALERKMAPRGFHPALPA